MAKSTYGTSPYGPHPDGTVQTYFRISPEHKSDAHGLHRDLNLVKPRPGRDEHIAKLDHLRSNH